MWGKRGKIEGKEDDFICNLWSQRISFNPGRAINTCLSIFNNTEVNVKKDSTVDQSQLVKRERERERSGNM